jgi:hypothetical protein
MRQTQLRDRAVLEANRGPAHEVNGRRNSIFGYLRVLGFILLRFRLHSHEEESSAQTFHLGSTGELSVTDTIGQVYEQATLDETPLGNSGQHCITRLDSPPAR